MGRGINILYNLITLMMLLLSTAICIVTSAWVSGNAEVPESLRPPTPIDIPTLQARVLWTPSFTPLPSETPLPTLTRTATATWTATNTQTATNTLTPSPSSTSTITPTWTPSSTFTPSATATQTATATETPTITLTPTEPGPTATATLTPAPFPFEIPVASGGLRIRAAQDGSCASQAFAGNVFDLLNNPVDGYQIVVNGPGLPTQGAVTSSGTNLNYGPGGWEIIVSTGLVQNTYRVQLRAPDGTLLSSPLTYTFSGSCSETWW
ncbi:MAG: hypothetical protein HC915_06295 [Anaerolineae bacterium]|nr:hypothetical protein [Anaerolineae bacterium]